MLLYGVEEVVELLGLKRGRAYRLIKEINNEMAAKGYITIPGKVNRKYLLNKLGFTEEDLRRAEDVSA